MSDEPNNPTPDASLDGKSKWERELRERMEQRAKEATEAEREKVKEILRSGRGVVRERITAPTAALIVLNHNPINREISQSKVTGYAADMRAGDWRLNHQGIAITPDGKLGDGQHRLIACAESGVAIEVYVTSDVPLDVIHGTTDMTKPRTPGQALTMAGVDNGKMLADVAKDVMSYVALRQGQKKPYLSNIGLQREVMRLKPILDRAILVAVAEWEKAADPAYSRREATTVAALAMFDGWSDERVEAFLHSVLQSEADYPEAPTVALQRLLLKSKVSGRSKDRLSGIEKLALSLKAARQWSNRQSVGRLTWDERKDGYPSLVAATPEQQAAE
jgi:hypothetical protein